MDNNTMNDTKEDNRSLLWLETAFSKAIRLNHDGIDCLRTNKIEKALEVFTIALENHEKLKLQLKAKMMAKKSNSGTTPTRWGNSNSNGKHRTSSVDDFFVRHNRHRHTRSSSSSSLVDGEGEGEEDSRNNDNTTTDTDDILFRDPIRLPSIDDIVLMIETNSSRCEPFSSSELTSNIMHFLSTCHAFNLALASHLCGLELVLNSSSSSGSGSGSGSASTNTNTNTNTTSTKAQSQQYFNDSGRLYEFTIRMVKSRLKKSKHTRSPQDKKSSTSNSSTWFGPRLVLACMNNLADVYYQTNNRMHSQNCYTQLQITTNRLLDLRLREQHGVVEHREEQERTLDSDLQYYFPIFLTNACRGMSRLRVRRDRNVVVVAPIRTSPKHYVMNSYAAGAA